MSPAYDLTTASDIGTSGYFDLDTITTSEGSLRFAGDTTDFDNFYIYDHFNHTIKWFTTTPAVPTYTISGTVSEEGTLAERTVRLYLQSTGALVDSVVSTAVTGAFSFTVDNNADHFVMAFDATAGDDFNALVFDKITPI